MSCIVGLMCGNTVWIGGDSESVAGHRRLGRMDEKVFASGEFVFGFTTSYRMGQLLQYSFQPPEHPKGMDSYRYLCTRWIDAVRECLKKGGFSEVVNNRETGGEFLLGYRGELYRVCSDFQIASSTEWFDAVGCGAEFAMGALETLVSPLAVDSFKISPKKATKVLTRALEVAAKFSAGVAPPFWIVDSVDKGD